MTLFVTGGAGYIGSHTCVELLQAGREVVVYDDFSNSHINCLTRIEQITGKKPALVRGDIRDRAAVENALREHCCSAVIHFAGLKAVGESVEKPIEYYDVNVGGTICLLKAMKATNVKQIVFSSSASVYGAAESLPMTENHPLCPTNPYARNKHMIEELLKDTVAADPAWRVAILRYFNPIGAHESGLIGEDPRGIPNNLLPYVAQVAAGKRAFLQIFGDDYDTPDGTGVRDYLHVVDLAKGHVCALERLAAAPESFTVNLGAGRGYSVLDVVKAFEQVSGKPVPYKIAPRRAGDVSTSYAAVEAAHRLLKWKTERDLVKMCSDSWKWQTMNPNGFETSPKAAS